MATGEAHMFNVLKFKILAGLLKARQPVTTKELAEIIDVDVNNIRSELSHWSKRGIAYARRLPKQAKWGAFRYKITKAGIRAYLDYKNRIKHGLSLNRLHPQPKKATVYMAPSACGKRSGVTIFDVDFSLKSFEERLATA